MPGLVSRNFANYIGGHWVDPVDGARYERFNPYRPTDLVGEFPSSDEADVQAAVEAASTAFPGWSRTPLATRGEILTRAAALLEASIDQIASGMTREMGKPVRESRMEVMRAARIFRFFGAERWRSQGEIYAQEHSGSAVYTRRRPLGVVGLITPWNFPVAIPAWKSAPALMYGNTVVWKVAQDAPETGIQLARCLHEAGLPAGVLNLVIGRGSAVGTPLVRSPMVIGISFTGSVDIGHSVRDQATALGKSVQLELGGQNPMIVMADADLDRAVEAAYVGAFWSAGQKCTATRRIYLEAAVEPEFRRRLLERVSRGRVGDPADPETEVGPLVNASQLENVLAAIDVGKTQGGTLLAGGRRLDSQAYLVAPTIFADVADDAMLAREEVFGPVVSLQPFDTFEQAIERANAVEFGLSAAIFTASLSSARQFVDSIDAGILHVNSQTAGADVHVPFGGIKASGLGPHEQGRAALEFFTEQVTVYEDI